MPIQAVCTCSVLVFVSVEGGGAGRGGSPQCYFVAVCRRNAFVAVSWKCYWWRICGRCCLHTLVSSSSCGSIDALGKVLHGSFFSRSDGGYGRSQTSVVFCRVRFRARGWERILGLRDGNSQSMLSRFLCSALVHRILGRHGMKGEGARTTGTRRQIVASFPRSACLFWVWCWWWFGLYGGFKSSFKRCACLFHDVAD